MEANVHNRQPLYYSFYAQKATKTRLPFFALRKESKHVPIVPTRVMINPSLDSPVPSPSLQGFVVSGRSVKIVNASNTKPVSRPRTSCCASSRPVSQPRSILSPNTILEGRSISRNANILFTHRTTLRTSRSTRRSTGIKRPKSVPLTSPPLRHYSTHATNEKLKEKLKYELQSWMKETREKGEEQRRRIHTPIRRRTEYKMGQKPLHANMIRIADLLNASQHKLAYRTRQTHNLAHIVINT